MPTGACGINCDVCRLNTDGICSSCGSGTSPAGQRKLAAQEKLLGAPCAILACAILNNVAHCLHDCDAFPCENFGNGTYPFSSGYLDMQKRRRTGKEETRAPYGDSVVVPPEYWQELREADVRELCPRAAVMNTGDGAVMVTAFNKEIRVDPEKKEIQRGGPGQWRKTIDPFLELMLLVYLLNVSDHPFMNEMVGARDLKDAQFFQGPHELKTGGLAKKFGEHPEQLLKAGDQLGGNRLQMADAAICLRPLPKIPVYYLLWEADEEFPAKVSILFDRSIESHLSADAIWGIVSVTTDTLLNA
ncbi:MAG: DUF3786 domain-containing protein [Desulfobacterales bacterium]|nr:DUF3786 domain-containing protein [Desulfobacterales bacterium]